MYLADAANVATPAYLTILTKGYAVRQEDGFLIATKGQDRFSAEGPVALLGLIAVAETRGEDWRATDAEIAEYLARFG